MTKNVLLAPASANPFSIIVGLAHIVVVSTNVFRCPHSVSRADVVRNDAPSLFMMGHRLLSLERLSNGLPRA